MGFMSNRGRVNCASYLVYDLKIDWTWGAAYFESKLIDYDLSSNWMNWHMQAFEIWYTNPVHQSNKYKAQDFIRKWVPELSGTNDIEALIPWEFDVPEYVKPIEIYSKWGRAVNLIKKVD
ncbi:FAD-binding domain-containing protein [Pedobacter westerhofensis]|nr:FAD-binding domain-containing protein [Pedobacter westerhofensis]